MMLHRHFENERSGKGEEIRSKLTTSTSVSEPMPEPTEQELAEQPKRGRPKKTDAE